MSAVVIDLPALAAEYEALSATVPPLTEERLLLARGAVAEVHNLSAALDRLFARALSALEHGEPGTDFDFLVRDLLDMQGRLCGVQTHVTSSMQLLMRANISLTAACTLATCDGGESA